MQRPQNFELDGSAIALGPDSTGTIPLVRSNTGDKDEASPADNIFISQSRALKSVCLSLLSVVGLNDLSRRFTADLSSSHALHPDVNSCQIPELCLDHQSAKAQNPLHRKVLRPISVTQDVVSPSWLGSIQFSCRQGVLLSLSICSTRYQGPLRSQSGLCPLEHQILSPRQLH